MTRARIIELLDVLVLELANNVEVPIEHVRTTEQVLAGQVGIASHEWAYVKGLASAQLLQFRRSLEGLS